MTQKKNSVKSNIRLCPSVGELVFPSLRFASPAIYRSRDHTEGEEREKEKKKKKKKGTLCMKNQS
jgi:hypothetical protein